MSDKIASLDGALGPQAAEPLEPARADAAEIGAAAGVPGPERAHDAAAIAESSAVGTSPAVSELSAMFGPGAIPPGLDAIAAIAHALDHLDLDPLHAVDLLVDHCVGELEPLLASAGERLAMAERVRALLAHDPQLAGLGARLGVDVRQLARLSEEGAQP